MVRLGALGDVVRTLPAFRALRAGYPGAHITWLVERKAAGALAGQPGLDEVLVFPREELSARLRAWDLPGLWRRARSVRASLRARRFDLVLDFHGILKSGLLSRMTGAPVRVGYAPPHGRELAWLFANLRVRLDPMRLTPLRNPPSRPRTLPVRVHPGLKKEEQEQHPRCFRGQIRFPQENGSDPSFHLETQCSCRPPK